jgi:hypothetical protein
MGASYHFMTFALSLSKGELIQFVIPAKARIQRFCVGYADGLKNY